MAGTAAVKVSYATGTCGINRRLVNGGCGTNATITQKVFILTLVIFTYLLPRNYIGEGRES